MDTIRWGTDYLMKVHQGSGADNSSMLVTRVGDIGAPAGGAAFPPPPPQQTGGSRQAESSWPAALEPCLAK